MTPWVFVSRLPHNLVDAFKSTLERPATPIAADDCGRRDGQAAEQLAVTTEVLHAGLRRYAAHTVYNKCDTAPALSRRTRPPCAQVQKQAPAEPVAGCHKRGFGRAGTAATDTTPYNKLALADTVRSFGHWSERKSGRMACCWRALCRQTGPPVSPLICAAMPIDSTRHPFV